MAISDMSPALQRALAHKQRMAIAWRPYAKAAPAPVALAPRRAPASIPLAETRSSAVVLDDAALAEWADGLTTRVGLQAELTWVGLNDGYVDAGGNDVAIPYLGLYWILGPVIKQHCFPAGTPILTPSGERPIESIKIGDLVNTLSGPRRVTRLYRNAYRGGLVRVQADGRDVQCTPNHPFLTGRGWVDADKLLAGDQAVLAQDGGDFIAAHITLPNARDRIPTRPQVGVLSAVSALLRQLPLGQRSESRVAVPVVPIGLDDQVADANVNNELVLDDHRRLKIYPHLSEDIVQSGLQFAGLVSLYLPESGQQPLTSRRRLFRMIHVPALDLCHRFLAAHRILLNHVALRGVVNQSPVRSGRQMHSVLGRLSAHLVHGKSQRLSHHLWTFSRIVGAKIDDLLPRHHGWPLSTACTPPIGIRSATFQADGSIAVPAMSAFWTHLRFAWALRSPLDDLRQVGIPAIDAAELPHLRAGEASINTGSALSASELHPHNVSPFDTSIPQEITVYNLEVEDVHQYIAGGFVVHNCFQCPEIANGSPYDPPGKGGHTIDQSPGDGGTVCGAGCKCWLEYGLPLVSVPKNYAWSNNVFPGPGKATAEIGAQQLQRQAASYSWQETMLLNPESEYLSDAQKGALDLFRAKWFAWEDVRGTLPQAPDMFAGADAAQSLHDLDTFWETLTAQQSNILIDLQEAIGVWNDATAEANGLLDASLDDGADLGGDGGDDAEQLAESGADEAIQLFSFGRAFGGAGAAGRGAHGVGSAFDSLHPRGFHGKFRFVNGGHHAGEGGQREHAGNAEHAGGQRGASKEERSPNAHANRRVLRGKVNDSERTSRLARMAKRTGSAEKSPNEGAARRSGAVKAGGRAKAKGEPVAKSARTPKEGAVKTAKAAKPQKTAEEKLVAQRTTQLARAKSQNQAGYSEHLRSTAYGGMAAYRMPKAEWFGPGGPHAMQVRAAQLNLANARTLAKGDTAWKGEEHPPFSKSEFLRATLKPMNSRQQGHNPGFTTKIGETTYHIKLVQRDTALASETAIRFIKGSENAAYQAHAEQAATEIGHLLGVGEHMVDAHSFQVGNNHFVATKFQTGVKPLGNQEKGATPAKEAALFKTIGEGGAARLMLHEYLTGNGDAHAANVLTSAKTGEVKIIDFGRAFTQPGALMQGSHSPTRPVVNSWFRATAAKLGIKGASQKLVTEAPQKAVYKAMHIPHEAVQHALGQESRVMGILHAHGLDAAVKTTQARFNVLRQLGNDTSLQHFDELQIKAFVAEGSQGRGAVDFSEAASDDAIQLFSIGGALHGLLD